MLLLFKNDCTDMNYWLAAFGVRERADRHVTTDSWILIRTKAEQDSHGTGCIIFEFQWQNNIESEGLIQATAELYSRAATGQADMTRKEVLFGEKMYFRKSTVDAAPILLRALSFGKRARENRHSSSRSHF